MPLFLLRVLMKLSVRFKSVSEKKNVDGKKIKNGNYRYWSVVGLIVSKMNEEYSQYENSNYLNEEIIISTYFNLL